MSFPRTASVVSGGFTYLWQSIFALLCFAWIILPAQFHTPIETIALFAPDAYVVIVTLTALSLGWALVRTFLTLRPRHLMNYASS